MQITLKKDASGYLAEVNGQSHIFAWGETKIKAKQELAGVVEMMMDYHLEQVEIERKLKAKLTKSVTANAI